jgi:peptide/nickel transport system ATP-binding protein
MNNAESALLEARNLEVRYGTACALSDVSLSVRPGETVGIAGESGSGKSTLARTLLALQPVKNGSVWFDGSQVSGRSEREIRPFRRRAQMVFQDPMSSLNPRMTVHRLLSEPLRALGIKDVPYDRRVAELLDAVHLPRTAVGRYPHEFSGGQRQRLAIARALAPRPDLLIADEAVSALDISVRAQVLNELVELIGRFRLTLVFVSHDMSVIRHLCDRVVVMNNGSIVEDGTVDQVFDAPKDGYTRRLLAAVPRLDGDAERRWSS